MSALISIAEFQEMVSVSRSTVLRLIERGEIRCVHIGRAVRIPSEDVASFIARLQAAK
jgi:excisionase family DNA binding protein